MPEITTKIRAVGCWGWIGHKYDFHLSSKLVLLALLCYFDS